MEKSEYQSLENLSKTDQQRINILHCSASLSDLSEAVTGVQCSGAGVLEKALNADFFFLSGRLWRA